MTTKMKVTCACGEEVTEKDKRKLEEENEGLLGASSEVSTLVQTLVRLDWKNEASVGESDPQRLN
jgi:hypothetical protein